MDQAQERLRAGQVVLADQAGGDQHRDRRGGQVLQPPVQVVLVPEGGAAAVEASGGAVLERGVVAGQRYRRGELVRVHHRQLGRAVAAGRVAENGPAGAAGLNPERVLHRLRHVLREERLGLWALGHVGALGVARQGDRDVHHHVDGGPDLAAGDQVRRGGRQVKPPHDRPRVVGVPGQPEHHGKAGVRVRGLEVLRWQVDVVGRADDPGVRPGDRDLQHLPHLAGGGHGAALEVEARSDGHVARRRGLAP